MRVFTVYQENFRGTLQIYFNFHFFQKFTYLMVIVGVFPSSDFSWRSISKIVCDQ